MASKNKITVPDGQGNYIEWYKIPESVQAGNAWLKRCGVENVRFGTNRGQAVLRLTQTKQIVMQSSNIESICIFLMISPWQHQLHLKRDWYMDEEMCLRRKDVEIATQQIKSSVDWKKIINNINRYNINGYGVGLKIWVGDANKYKDASDYQELSMLINQKALYFDNDYKNINKISSVMLFVISFFDNEHAKKLCEDFNAYFNKVGLTAEWIGGQEPFVKIYQ